MSEIDEKISTSGVIFGALIVQAGAKGDTGPQGEQGIQGIPGETGKDGKDYILTESDKQEIANNVKSSIQSTLDALSNKDASQDIEITDIKTKNNTQDARLDTLEADNTTNKENILNLQNDNTTNKSVIKSLQDDNEINKTDIQGIKQEQITQNTNIQELQTDNTSNKAKIELLETKNAEQDTNIQKNTEEIESINKKDTTQDKLIEELQTKVVSLEAENTSLKNQIPSGEATGNPIHLTDSSDLECEIAVVGNSEQETRSGSNILNFNVAQDSRVTVNDDGTFTINGAGGFGLKISPITLKSGVTYYEKVQLVSGTITSDEGLSIKDAFMGFNSSSWIPSASFLSYTPSEDVSKSSIWINAGVTFENAVIKLWANTDQSDFEQYGASPSPDYPSEIVTVGQNGSVEIEVCNKNFLGLKDIEENTLNGITYSCKNGVIKLNGTATSSFGIILKHNKFTLFKGIKYVGKMIVTNKPGVNTSVISIRDMNNNSRFYMECWVSPKIIEITPEDNIYFKDDEKTNLWINSGTIFSNTEFIIQIEEGSNATDYIPHESYTKVLPIQEEMLEGDYIEDVEHHGWGKYEITGNEDWKKSGNPNNISYYLIINSILVNINKNTLSPSNSESQTKVAVVLSNHFKAISPNQLFEGSENGICLNWVGEKKEMRLGFGLDSDINTVDKLKAWLKSLYDAGTPVIVYYKLATPKSLELTEDQKSVLNSFYTYKGITNISVDGIATLKVNYKKDLETIINKLLATSVAE